MWRIFWAHFHRIQANTYRMFHAGETWRSLGQKHLWKLVQHTYLGYSRIIWIVKSLFPKYESDLYISVCDYKNKFIMSLRPEKRKDHIFYPWPLLALSGSVYFCFFILSVFMYVSSVLTWKILYSFNMILHIYWMWNYTGFKFPVARGTTFGLLLVGNRWRSEVC